MAFLSGNRRNGGAAGIFGQSALLPTSTPRSKTLRMSSRRRSLLPSPNSTFFALGLSISFLLFIAVVIRYGVPNPLSRSPYSSHSPKPRLTRRPNIRRSISDASAAGASSGFEIASAAVDFTTKDLYDRIEFLDIDGGPWKQGWRVSYVGNEWDEEKLKVFVVPHSHNDPGWKLTAEEYYERQSRPILDTIVEALSKDERRKFIWEEMSYLQRWWRDSSKVQKDKFVRLVESGQLEIVGGGWVMNDEANSHYFAIIEQMMEGNMWLNETIGVIPKNSWSIDPFGYSATMAYLLRRMGFQNMLIQRTHYELKKELALNKNLEFVWRQSWDVDETTDMFVHMMPFYSYDVPHTCGPEPAVCCQFDFARMRGRFGYEACPWRIDPVETDPSNVQQRASLLLDQYKKKSTLYRTNTLLIPLGDDFRYVSVEEAEAQFRNYQTLFDYINSNPSLNTEIKFGTLDDYFSTLREEAYRINFSRPNEVGSGELEGFPSLSGDFFTYADRQQDYWSGYYVSRPFFKAVDRVLEQTLRASEMMASLVMGYCHKLPCSKLPVSFAHKMTAARRSLALFQHHDGVTGTAKDHVVQDYGNRMHTSLQDLQIFMSRAVEVLLSDVHNKTDPTLLSYYEPEQTRARYDAQTVHKAIDLKQKHAYSVAFFNPIEQVREETVMVIITHPDVSVLDSNGSCVPSQIAPEWQHDSKGKVISSGQHRLYWRASVHPLGLETYSLVRGLESCEKPVPAELKVFTDETESFSCPSPYTCSNIEGDQAEIGNIHQKLVFDVKHGLLRKIIYNKDGRQTVIGEEIGMYSSSGSGAYLFKPTGEAQPIVQRGGSFIISEGLLVQEAYSLPKTRWNNLPISHSTRIYTGEKTLQELFIEKEYHVELLGYEFNDKELIVRFNTDIDSGRVFHSDLNGFQMSRRETYDKIPLQGNYYPMPSLAFLQDSVGHRFSVHSRQSLGTASLKSGSLEIMLDRRLVNDDGRGLGQGVMDNRPMNVMFHILTESNVSALPSNAHQVLSLKPSLLSHRVGAHLNYPMHAFLSKKQKGMPLNLPFAGSFAPLASPLPCDLHVVNFKVPQPMKVSQMNSVDPRFVITLQRRGWDTSYCRRGGLQCSTVGDEPVNLLYLFKDLTVLNLKGTSLNLLHDDTEMLGYIERLNDVAQEGNVLLSPMDLQAYKLELGKQ